MTVERVPGHVAVIVNNTIDGDSRVIKTAISAARAGYRVTLVGRSLTPHRQESWLGPIRVIRLPLQRTFHDRYEAIRRAQWAREDRERGGGDGSAPDPRRKVLPEVAPENIEWRRDWPIVTDWWMTFGPELVNLEPDVIHANDVHMIAVGARVAADLRLAGHRVSWLYDAHERVSAVDWGTPAVSAAYHQVEREFISIADAVVTVSESIAAGLAQEYHLAQRPDVVANAPVAQAPPSDRSVRADCGLDEATPLLVYVGVVAPPRGIDVVVESLPHLDGVHLALVTNNSGPYVDDLTKRAEDLGVASRVHLLPYVSPFAVPAYISSASIGLSPHHPMPNHQASLPTKFAEYLHARLPIVASRMNATAEFIERNGVGVAFEPSNAVDLARAVRDALEHSESIRSAISEEILDELSWERQARTLISTYERISGISAPATDTPPAWDVTETP